MSLDSSHLTDNKGYTLAELLVVLALGSIVLYLASVTYLFSQQYVHQWNNQVHLVNASQIISQSISVALFQADKVTHLDETELFIERRDGSVREFRVDNGALSVNLRTVNINQAILTNLQFLPILDDSPAATASSGESWMKGVEVSVVVAIKTDTLSSKRLVMLRQPVMWNDLKK
ncbi:hypothetical protein BH23BAC3_BH23BAC3_22340 [soil metagenome]